MYNVYIIGIVPESKFCIFFIISLSIQIEYLMFVHTFPYAINLLSLSLQIVFVSLLV